MMRLLTLILFLIFFSFPLQVKATEADLLASVQVDSVQADFTQEKQLPILVRPIISKGRFVFQAPDSLRWEYFSPVRTVLLMHDGHIRKFVQHGELFKEEQGMGVDSMQIVLQEITGWLDGEITDTPTFKVHTKDNNRIILTPRQEALAKIISSIELKLLGQTGLMESVTLNEGEKSLTRMVFSDGKLNEKIPAVTFIKP
ncbi:MAG TPA: outer membrane lipoprotein carrier protein LolA [Desulfocapsa sulfexigens]|nr:outer membrane lipoprotein carrier protein LolA [Desulfocapsa sulfexigens]